jgi:hypothetical protein
MENNDQQKKISRPKVNLIFKAIANEEIQVRVETAYV